MVSLSIKLDSTSKKFHNPSQAATELHSVQFKSSGEMWPRMWTRAIWPRFVLFCLQEKN